MTTRIKTSPLSPTTRHKQSTPSAPDAALLPARSADALPPHLLPLLELVADLIARDVLAQPPESHTGLGPEETRPMTKAEAISSLNEEGGTSRSHSQNPANFSSKVPPQSHRHPHVDDPVTIQEKKL